MRHRKSTLRLKYKPQHSRMMERNLVTSLLLYESIRTTRMRAKVIQPMVDHLVTVAKTKPVALAIRRINAVVTDRNACRKIIEVLKDRYALRSSGLTRMVPVGARQGDGAKMVDVSLMDMETSSTNTGSSRSSRSSKSSKSSRSSKSAKGSKSSTKSSTSLKSSNSLHSS